MKELYMHIGQSKTGSSALQVFLKMNRELLMKKGIYYPILDGEYALREKNSTMSGNAAGLLKLDKPLEQFDELDVEYMYKIENLFAHNERVLLSNENIWSSSPHLYKNIKSVIGKLCRVKIIVYVRRQDERLESDWNQGVKSFRVKDNCNEFVDKNISKFAYYKHLNEISEIVGKENVIVKIYDSQKSSVGNNIFIDFMSIFDINDISEFKLPEYQVNPSLGKNMVEIKRILNTIPSSMVLDNEIRKILRECTDFARNTDAIKKKPNFLTFEQRKDILEKFEEDNIKIGKEYFGIDRSPFPKLIEEDYNTDDEKDMYIDIVRFFGQLAIEQSKEIEELRSMNEHFELPQRVLQGSRIIVYGADKKGRRLYHWLKHLGQYKVEGVVDRRFNRLKCIEPDVEEPSSIFRKEFDYILIGVTEEVTASSIREWLESSGIAADKIIIVA
jgi:hypothetical protein